MKTEFSDLIMAGRRLSYAKDWFENFSGKRTETCTISATSTRPCWD